MSAGDLAKPGAPKCTASATDEMADLVTAELEEMGLQEGEDEDEKSEREDEEKMKEAVKGEAGERAKETEQLNNMADTAEDGDRLAAISNIDALEAERCMAALVEQMQAAAKKREAERTALAAVKVSKEDVEFLAREFEMDANQAEMTLRRKDGVLVAAVDQLLSTFPAQTKIGIPQPIDRV
eukprot:Selendium_serpulae@DN2897_c0_g1_i1.p2